MSKKKQKEDPIKGWKATTPTRSVVIYAKDIEEAAMKFMERFGYYPDYNFLEPVFDHSHKQD